MISLRQLSKSYHKNQFILYNFSLDIAAGEFLAILGPSGCGKTTLLRLIAGLDSPDEGDIFLEGNNITHLPAEERPINTVFQNYALFPHMTVAQNIAFGLRIRKVPKQQINRAVEEILNRVHLGGYENRMPHELSGGQKQRVALARALVNQPKVLLLDEPMAALDENLRRKMQLELKELQRATGITFVMVTHDQDEAMALADHIALINAGKLEQYGTPAQLYYQPCSEFAARFLGENNFFHFEKIFGSREIYRFELGQLEFPGLSLNSFKAAVRPEAIKLVEQEQQALFSGTIQSIIFKGATITTSIRVKDDLSLLAEFPAEYTNKIKEGSTVHLSFSSQDVIIWDKVK